MYTIERKQIIFGTVPTRTRRRANVKYQTLAVDGCETLRVRELSSSLEGEGIVRFRIRSEPAGSAQANVDCI